MKHTVYDLQNKKRGDIVEITLNGNAANVRLMDYTNYQSYKRNGRCRYTGGLANKSIIKLQIPNSGH